MPAYTLAHLSDPHLAPLPEPRWSELIGKRVTGYLNWQHRRHLIHRPQVLAKIVADLKTSRPNHVVVTGDLANLSLPREFPRGRAWLEALGTSTHLTVVPGNHDSYVRATALEPMRQWGAFMRSDNLNADFPFIRRRGPLALIGLSTAVPTAPFLATGWLGAAQLGKLPGMLDALHDEGRFRVILLHHPPITKARSHKRLLDAEVFLRVIVRHGAELILHGHDHSHMVNWLEGPRGLIPAVGVSSASADPNLDKEPAGYNMYRVSGSPGDWSCEMLTRGFRPGGSDIVELSHRELGAV